jgi:hypothetical protein
MTVNLKHFVIAVTLIDGTHVTYPAMARTSFDALDAALATFGVCKVTAKAAPLAA